MKLQVKTEVIEEVEVEVPFYFRHDLDREVIYGWVTEGRCLMIHEEAGSRKYNIRYEIELERNHPNYYTCYLKPEYSSSKEEFFSALKRAQDWVTSL